MTQSGPYNYDFRNRISQNLQVPDQRAEMASEIGRQVQRAEKAYVDLLTDPNAKTEDVEKARVQFQKQLTAFKGFQEIMDAFFQTMREGIRKLNVR